MIIFVSHADTKSAGSWQQAALLAADELLRAHRNPACMDLSLEIMAFDGAGCYVAIESARRRPATSSALRGNKVPVNVR